MEYFLPIAQVEINILFIFGLSLAVGVLSGLFGVGGGFLMTPFLIFLGRLVLGEEDGLVKVFGATIF